MKKILIGICGIGNGHINRQLCVIEELLKDENVKLVVATSKEKKKFIEKQDSRIKVFEVDIPWITCNKNGVDYKDCLIKYKNKSIDQFKSFLEFAIKVEDEFCSKPDLIITDYEPNVAQYAYASNVPLIGMEQQSKFIYIDEIALNNSSIKEEIYRINYFFPKYDKKIISSFFPVKIKEHSNILIVPPIIPELKKYKKSMSKVVVYFSPYSENENYEKILKILEKIEGYTFNVYTSNDYSYLNLSKKIKILKFSSEFKKDLSTCCCLLTTAGHQLLSEAISLNVPSYVFPLNTYEQKYNALMVEKYKLGVIAKEITVDEILSFFEKCDEISSNIKIYKNKNYNCSWKEEIKKIINEY